MIRIKRMWIEKIYNLESWNCLFRIDEFKFDQVHWLLQILETHRASHPMVESANEIALLNPLL